MEKSYTGSYAYSYLFCNAPDICEPVEKENVKKNSACVHLCRDLSNVQAQRMN